MWITILCLAVAALAAFLAHTAHQRGLPVHRLVAGICTALMMGASALPLHPGVQALSVLVPDIAWYAATIAVVLIGLSALPALITWLIPERSDR